MLLFRVLFAIVTTMVSKMVNKLTFFFQTNNMEVPQIITDIVKRNGFDYAEYLGEYKGEQVFQPRFNSEEAFFGRPRYLHMRADRIRWSKNYREASKTMHFFYD